MRICRQQVNHLSAHLALQTLYFHQFMQKSVFNCISWICVIFLNSLNVLYCCHGCRFKHTVSPRPPGLWVIRHIVAPVFHLDVTSRWGGVTAMLTTHLGVCRNNYSCNETRSYELLWITHTQ